MAAIANHLRDPRSLQSALPDHNDEELQHSIGAAGALADRLADSDGSAQKELISTLGLQTRVGKDAIQAELDLSCLQANPSPRENIRLTSTIEIPTTAQWNGHETRLKLEPPTGTPSKRNNALLNLIARAFDARDELLALGEDAVKDMPLRHRRHIERTARLSYLAPDIVLAILDGTQPSHLSARKLVRAASLPLDWAAQRRVLLVN